MVFVIVPTVYRDTWQECCKYLILKSAPNPTILCITIILSKYSLKRGIRIIGDERTDVCFRSERPLDYLII